MAGRETSQSVTDPNTENILDGTGLLDVLAEALADVFAEAPVQRSVGVHGDGGARPSRMAAKVSSLPPA